MKLKMRYKKTGRITFCSKFNVGGLFEVITEDDSAFIKDLDVYLTKKQEWKDLGQAFKNKDLIPDNLNVWFYEPENEVERKQRYRL